MRFTLDSNILVRAVTSPRGPALRVLDTVLGAHTLVLSRFILDEVERVLLCPRLQARYRITPEEARLAGSLADASHLVEPVVVRPIILSDPDEIPCCTRRWTGRRMSCVPGISGTSHRRRFAASVPSEVTAS